MHSLSDSTQGYTYTIKWMFGLPEVMKSMHDMNIHEGSTIRVLRKFHDSLIISSANRKIVLGNEVADRIHVSKSSLIPTLYRFFLIRVRIE